MIHYILITYTIELQEYWGYLMLYNFHNIINQLIHF